MSHEPQSTALTLFEAWGDIVDPNEWRNDDPAFGYGRVGVPVYQTSIFDRDDGRYLPVYQTQSDLRIIRAMSRNVASLSAGVEGALGTLANFTLGTGFTFAAQANPNCPAFVPPEVVQELAKEAQRVIDRFLLENRFQANMDREVDRRARMDGEAFIELCLSPAGQIRASFDEPDMVCEPANSRQWEQWLACEDPERYSPEWERSWSFGVHSVKKTPDDPLGYHVVYDTLGNDADYVEASRMVHVKANVPRNAKRGISDLYPVIQDIEREAKIRRNIAVGTALQAAIAWIREHATGVTPAAVQNMVTGNSVATRQQRTSSGTRPIKGGTLQPGTVIDTPENMKHITGPMGSERNPNFILVAQYVSRSIAQRWSMPEFMYTSDASNANYASTLVAESPFVKAREADQRFYGQHFIDLLWKVLRMAHTAGKAFVNIQRFEELLQILDITASGQRVSNRDELATVQRQEIQMRMGILSRQSAAAEGGLDLAKEEQQGAAPQQQPVETLGTLATSDAVTLTGPAAVADVASTAMNGAQVSSLVDFITQVAAGTLPSESAIQAITLAFPTVSLDQARAMINPAAAQSGIAPPTLGPDGKPVAAPAKAGGELVGMKLRDVSNIDKLRTRYLDAFKAGEADEKATRIALDGLGYSKEKIDLYLDADPTNDPAEETPDEATPVTEELDADVTVTPEKKPGTGFPKGVPTQEDILTESQRQLDELFEQLAEATASNASKPTLVKILKEIDEVQNRAVLAADICGRLTPFKPTLQDGDSAQTAPVDPLAAVVKVEQE